MLDTKLLMTIQDRVFEDPAYQPKGKISFCNLATLAVCRGVGCLSFDPTEGQDPLLADEMHALMQGSVQFKPVTMEEAITLAQDGVFILAALPHGVLNQSEGHICTLTIGEPEFSGNWGREVPACMNIGRVGTCFRNRGVNWAFRKVPDFFAWKESL